MNGRERKILIVDDDVDFAASVGAFLGNHGFEVVHAADGDAALEAARRHAPDLVLMDVMMGERTAGLFAIQRMRRDQALREIPVFLVSSLYEQIPGFRILPDPGWAGHDEFFPKPLELDRLLARIEARLAVIHDGRETP